MATETQMTDLPETVQAQNAPDVALAAFCELIRQGKLPPEAPDILTAILERLGPTQVDRALNEMDAEDGDRFRGILESVAGNRTVRIQDAAVRLSLFLVPAVMFTGEYTLAKPFVFTHHGMERLRHAMTKAGLLGGSNLLWTYMRPVCPEELARMPLARRAWLTGNIINERLDPALYAFTPPLPEYTCVPFFLAGLADTAELAAQPEPDKQDSLLREMVSALSESMEPAPGRFITAGLPMPFAKAMRLATSEFIALAVQGGIRMGASKLNLHLHDIAAIPGQPAGLRVEYENHPMEIDPMAFYLGGQQHQDVLAHVQTHISRKNARITESVFPVIGATL